MQPCHAECTPPCIAHVHHLDNAVGHAHLPAKRWQPDDQLDGVHVVRDAHHLRLAALDQGGDVVQAELDNDRLLLLSLLASCARLCLRLEPVPLLLLVLGAVLEQQLEQRLGLVLVHCLGHELVDDRGHLEAHAQHALLPLQAHVLGPLDEAVEIGLGGRCAGQT